MNMIGADTNVHAIIVVAIIPEAIPYLVASTYTVGAVGKVPYKNAKFAKSLHSSSFDPAYNKFVISLANNGINITLLAIKIKGPSNLDPFFNAFIFPTIPRPRENNAIAEYELLRVCNKLLISGGRFP